MPDMPDLPLRQVLFGKSPATPCTPTMSSTSFNPQTPGLPASLTALVLSDTPASDAKAFRAVLSAIISDSLGYNSAQKSTLDTQLGAHLAEVLITWHTMPTTTHLSP